MSRPHLPAGALVLLAGCVVPMTGAPPPHAEDAGTSAPPDAGLDAGGLDAAHPLPDDAGAGGDGGDAAMPDAALPDAAAPDAAAEPRPGAPLLADPGDPVYRYQPYTLRWQAAADDAARAVVVTQWEVQESKDATFTAGVRRLFVTPPAARLARVQPTPGFAGATSVTFHYRVRGRSAGGAGVFSNVETKVIESTWTPVYVSVGFAGPNNPPFNLSATAFTVDDVAANNARGTFQKSGPGWLDTTDPNKGYRGHYWYVSTNAPLPRDGTERATWTPTVTRAGRYETWIGFYRSENRDTHAEYFVTSDDGDTLGPFAVDQYLPPGGTHTQDTAWVKLGEFNYSIGTAAHVDLVWSPAGDRHSECADAVAFRRLGN